MRTFARNVLVALLALIPITALDYLYVRSGQNPNSIWFSAWLNVPALLVAPVGFFWANKQLWGTAPRPKQIFAVAVLALCASGAWFLLLAWWVVANFHIAIGGWL